MTYNQLLTFIINDMRMSHVYQPLMIIKLLESDGYAPRVDIAKALLLHDPSQVEYYEKIVDNMVGKVLRGREVVTKDRATKAYKLTLTDPLTEEQRHTLIASCLERLRLFEETRKADPYNHRRISSGYVSGSTRYNVLKRAKGRCELCGVKAEVKALEVDHIIPKSKGGLDEESNFQALCYSCNAAKGNKDDADFRSWGEFYELRDCDCLFCGQLDSRIVAENELAYVIRDAFPVTEGHTLVIPKRHVKDYFGLEQPELNAINQLLEQQKQTLEAEDSTIDGFNIGMNCGESAGQTVFHCHVHLIPRRSGDMEKPRGGVRHVIPSKGSY
jgi:ATP adenylyltransferase